MLLRGNQATLLQSSMGQFSDACDAVLTAIEDLRYLAKGKRKDVEDKTSDVQRH